MTRIRNSKKDSGPLCVGLNWHQELPHFRPTSDSRNINASVFPSHINKTYPYENRDGGLISFLEICARKIYHFYILNSISVSGKFLFIFTIKIGAFLSCLISAFPDRN
jgi:hypothetical protein